SLPRERMNAVGGITDQCRSSPDIPYRVLRLERERRAIRFHRQLAQYTAACLRQHQAERAVVRRLCCLRLPGGRRPYYRAAAIQKRQQRDRAFRQEPLPCAFTVISLGPYVRNQCRLTVAPGGYANPCLLPYGRRGAIGPDDEIRAQGLVATIKFDPFAWIPDRLDLLFKLNGHAGLLHESQERVLQ